MPAKMTGGGFRRGGDVIQSNFCHFPVFHSSFFFSGKDFLLESFSFLRPRFRQKLFSPIKKQDIKSGPLRE